MPVLFIHGTNDTVIPVSMSKQLYAAAPKPKQLFIVANAGHNNTAQIAGLKYFETIKKFVSQIDK